MKDNKINKYNHNNFDLTMKGKQVYVDILEHQWLNDPEYLKSCVMVEGITKDLQAMYKLRTISTRFNLNEFKSIRIRECKKKKGIYFAVLEVIDWEVILDMFRNNKKPGFKLIGAQKTFIKPNTDEVTFSKPPKLKWRPKIEGVQVQKIAT